MFLIKISILFRISYYKYLVYLLFVKENVNIPFKKNVYNFFSNDNKNL